MRKRLVIALLSLGICIAVTHKAVCQDVELPKSTFTSSSIPDSLRKNANSVIRYSYDEVKVNKPTDVVHKHHEVITILNEKGDRDAVQEYGYNRKYDTYSYVDMKLYDSLGNQLKKYHKSDMYDGSAIEDNETVATNDRFLAFRPVLAAYPETLEITYEEDLSGYNSFDTWYIQALEQSVQQAAYKIITRNDMGFRYDERKVSIKPEITRDSSYTTYLWTAQNYKAAKKEEEEMWWDVLPRIVFTTDRFNCYGYPGSMSTWQNYGQWVYDLNKDVCTLSPERTTEIQKMTDTIKSDKAKAKFLYEYLQHNTRYVSIQLGIGGWKPFDANFVATKNYGDCKALANYMYALLKAVNIPSYWAVVHAGINENGVKANYPENNFNHEILCVPFKNDTTWLDCTMQTREFGKPGPFTENRNALLITENGGKLVNTPRSQPGDNKYDTQVHVVLDSVGGAKAQIKLFCTGEFREKYIYWATQKEEDQKEHIFHDLNFKQPSVYSLKNAGDKDYTKEVDIDLEYDKLSDIEVGDKEFYRANLIDLWSTTLPVLEKRKSTYFFDFPRAKTCTTIIDLPKGFVIETLPVNQELKFTYGSYAVKYTYDAVKNQVISISTFTLNNQAIPADRYNEMQQYFEAVKKAENKKLVIRRKA
jgi:hypothetical protein